MHALHGKRFLLPVMRKISGKYSYQLKNTLDICRKKRLVFSNENTPKVY
jgi:hypothetical protein